MQAAALVVSRVVEPETFWLASMFVALGWSVVSAHRLGLDPRPMFWAGIAAVAGGIWGSHLLGIVVYGTEGPLIWLRVWVGGKSWYGGLIGGALAALAAFRVARLPVLRYADAMAPSVALGYAIGRVGCFFNGDDYGTPTSLPWAVSYGPGTEAFHDQAREHVIGGSSLVTVPIHPTQLYHSLFGLLLFAGLSLVGSEPPGRRLGLLAVGYGAGRFGLELLRGDFQAVVGPLSLHQCISLALIAAGAAILRRSRRGVVSPTQVALS